MRSSSFSMSSTSATASSSNTKPAPLPARSGSLNRSMARLRTRDSISASATPPKALLSSLSSASSLTSSPPATRKSLLASSSSSSSNGSPGSLSRASPSSSVFQSPAFSTATRRPRLSAIAAPSAATIDSNTLTSAAMKQHSLEEHKTAPSTSAASSASFGSGASGKMIRRRLSIMQALDNSSHLDGMPDPKQPREARIRSAKSPTAASHPPAAPSSSSSSSSALSALPSIAATRPKSLSYPSASAAPSTVSSHSPPQSTSHLASSAGRVFSHYASLSKVGYIPYNPAKVNQDRALELVRFQQSDSQALFAVFDGHGQLGHEVSSFLTAELPRQMAKQLGGLSPGGVDVSAALCRAFVDTNGVLAQRSGIDCTFSGSTGIVVYLAERYIYTCNVGDSRAVLARRSPTQRFTAHPLSVDQKPDRPDERRRIVECRGRVEACKGARGEDIGPARVWLASQDVPGLAMSRSFGDLIAASVGVIARPEVDERVRGREGDEAFVVLASDGVWEFMSDDEVVELVGRAGGLAGERPEDAARAVVEEATRRWQREEEVIDDITCVIVYF